MDRLLTTEEAARRLGVKVPTVYAYVSRGLLESHRDPNGRGSLFDLADIEALAARSRGGRQTATRLASVTTGVTRLDQQLGPIYRGHPATELAATTSFEEVAALLWQSDESGDWSAPDLGPSPFTETLDRMRWALVACGASDPLRADLRPVAVTRAAAAPPPRSPRWWGHPRPAKTPVVDRRPADRPPHHEGLRGAGRPERRPRPPGGPRARRLHLGRARRSLRARRPLRRVGRRTGDAGRTVARRRQPACLRIARSGGARRRRPARSTTCCASRAGCPVSGTPCTRRATPASTPCTGWPSRC